MKKEICKYCEYYNTYYIKHISSYSSTDNGFCCKHNKQQLKSETCDSFKSNALKEKRSEEFLLQYLEQSLKSINRIAQILAEKDSTEG